MKRALSTILALLLFCGCAAPAAQPAATDSVPESYSANPAQMPSFSFSSRFDAETVIRLADTGIDVTGPNSAGVFISRDIIYYENKDTYESGNPYGEGTDADKHTAEEAAKHAVVNITAPGTYRVTGTLSAGQIRIDLGKDARDDVSAVVELILDGADITCSVAPAILFMNVYECDGSRSEDTASPNVDTTHAGAILVLEGENTVSGAYVSKIFKDTDGEKKLWKQDGAIYSYMSLNVFGPGALTLNAANEGLDTELHLTLNGGDITILSGNDGINTNEDNVSVTTVNAGTLRIVAGLGEEGDGIDSNGYLVINGGTVISAAKPQSDSGLDSDRGSFIHGGTVVALGAAMDWAESDSGQVTMNLQFSRHQTGALRIAAEDGREVFSFSAADDPVLKDYNRGYQGAVISCPGFRIGDSYEVTADGTKMMYTSTDVMMGPGGGHGGFRPDGQIPGDMDLPEDFGGAIPEMPTRPEGEEDRFPDGNRKPPELFGSEIPTMPEGEMPTPPEGEASPEGFGGGHSGFRPDGQTPTVEGNARFHMQDKVNFFSGLTAAE